MAADGVVDRNTVEELIHMLDKTENDHYYTCEWDVLHELLVDAAAEWIESVLGIPVAQPDEVRQ